MRSTRSSPYGAKSAGFRAPSTTRSRTLRASRIEIERPSPMIGSLWPAASPISTTPSANGVAVHVSSPGYVAHGPAGVAAIT